MTHPDDSAFAISGMSQGLTIREYFAAKALQGLLINQKSGHWSLPPPVDSMQGAKPEWIDDSPKLAKESLKLADALIAELIKQSGRTCMCPRCMN